MEGELAAPAAPHWPGPGFYGHFLGQNQLGRLCLLVLRFRLILFNCHGQAVGQIVQFLGCPLSLTS